MREHQLVQKDNCYNCSVCQWMWHRPPREDCPGVKRYSYGTVPDHLVTFTELRRRKLKPGGPPVGAYRRMRSPYDYLYFYDINAAQPRRIPTRRQNEAIAKMRAALVTKHTCERCHMYDHTHGRSLVRVISLRIEGEEKRYCTWCRNTLIWQHDRQALEQALKELLESDIPLLIVDTDSG